MPSKSKKGNKIVMPQHSGKLKLAVSDSIVEKQPKSATSLPMQLMRSVPAGRDVNNAYSFGKLWYPIIVMDELEPDLVVPCSAKVTLAISIDGVELGNSATNFSRGAFWFASVVPFTVGRLQLKFSCADASIKPLLWDVDVSAHPEDVAEETAAGGTSSAEDGKFHQSKHSHQNSSDASNHQRGKKRNVSDVDANNDTTVAVANSKRGKETYAANKNKKAKTGGDSDIRHFLAPAAAITTIGSGVAAESKKQEKKRSESTQPTTATTAAALNRDAVELILPYPTENRITNKTRLEPFMFAAAGEGGGLNVPGNGSFRAISSVREKVKVFNLQGPCLQVSMSSALVRALIHDKEITAPKLVDYVSKHDSDGLSQVLQDGAQQRYLGFLPVNTQQPTTGELLQKLLERCTQHGPGGSYPGTKRVLHAEQTVERMRLLFEYFLEDYLLYPIEKLAFRKALGKMRDNHIPFTAAFGAAYYLRFLVMLVTATECSTSNSSGSSSSSSSSSSSKLPSSRRHQQHDELLPAETTASAASITTTTATTSSARRSARVQSSDAADVIDQETRNKQQKQPQQQNKVASTAEELEEAAEVQQLQDVLHVAVLCLDEHAHLLFI